MATNNVILHSCAYLFHWTYGNFYISKKEYESRQKVQKFLKENHGKPLSYTLTEKGEILVIFEGLNIIVNDSMILDISGEYQNIYIIKGRNFKDLTKFHTDNWRHFSILNCYRNGDDQSFWGLKFRSLEIEKFSNSLMYYRLHFKGNKICIISSCGRLFLAESCNYRELSKEDIFSRLDANSNEARKIFSLFFDYITK
jgi:hypothetical protein